MERQDIASAIADLHTWRLAEPQVFAVNNYDYLLARLSERNGDRATAAVNYQRVVARNSMLSQYALWHLAQFARMTGNLTLERAQLRQLLATAPESLLRDAASARLGESLFESGDYIEAIYELHQRSQSTVGPTAREAQALMGRAFFLNKQPQEAREIFNNLIAQLPDPSRPDDFALAAVRGLDAIDAGGGDEAAPKAAPQLPEAEHLKRAAIYHFNRDFERARLHYSALIERYPKSTSVAEATYQIGRSLHQEANYENSITYFTQVLEKYPDSSSARDALNFLGSAFTRLKRTDEAVAGFRRYIERYPDAPNPERPYLNIIDALRDAGRDQEALDWIEQTRNKFKGQLPAALAVFSRARIFLAQGAWARALAELDSLKDAADLGGTRVPGGTSATEIQFLRAFSLEQLGRVDDAVKAYLEIPDGRNEYYGGRATERLRGLIANEKTRDAVTNRLETFRKDATQSIAGGQPEKARVAAQSALRLTGDAAVTRDLLDLAKRAYAALPAYNDLPAVTLLPVGRKAIYSENSDVPRTPTPRGLADELLFLGLYDEGAGALAAAEDSSKQATPNTPARDGENKSSATGSVKPSSRDMAFTLAVIHKRGEHGDYAVRYAEPIWKNVPRDYLLELAPRELVELLYPAPFPKMIVESAPPRGVDPRFILSIMRQESRYRPDAKSIAAARGLMQFIPDTANKIAAELGKRDFRQDDLYQPKTAILFGSQYMGNLYKLFPAMSQAVAASYNGGEDNVARWVARARTNDPDRYVAEIGFAQSKDYVYKIMANFRVYQQLYDEQLRSR
jgi:soluble lytic murein transglycosylase